MSLRTKTQNLSKNSNNVNCLEKLPTIKSRTTDSKDNSNSKENSVSFSAKDEKAEDRKDGHNSRDIRTNLTIANNKKSHAEHSLEDRQESTKEKSEESEIQKNESMEEEEKRQERKRARKRHSKRKKERSSNSVVFSSIDLDNNVVTEHNNTNDSSSTSEPSIDKKSKHKTDKMEKVSTNEQTFTTKCVMSEAKAVHVNNENRTEKNQEREKDSRFNDKHSEHERHHDYTTEVNRVKSKYQKSNSDNVIDEINDSSKTSKKSEFNVNNAKNDKRANTITSAMKRSELLLQNNDVKSGKVVQEYHYEDDKDDAGKEEEEKTNDNLKGTFAFSSPEFSEIIVSTLSSSSPPEYTASSHSVRREKEEYERNERRFDGNEHRHRKKHHHHHHHHRRRPHDELEEEELKSIYEDKEKDSRERRRRTHALECTSPSILVTKRRAESLNPENTQNVVAMLRMWERNKVSSKNALLKEHENKENKTNNAINKIKNDNEESNSNNNLSNTQESIIREQDRLQSKIEEMEKCQEQHQEQHEEKNINEKTNDKLLQESPEQELEEEKQESNEFDLPTLPPWPCGLSLRSSFNTTKQSKKEEKTEIIVDKQTNRVNDDNGKVNHEDDEGGGTDSISCTDDKSKELADDHKRQKTFVSEELNIATPKASKQPVVWVANKLIPAPSVKLERTYNSDFDSNATNTDENETNSSTLSKASKKMESNELSNKENCNETQTSTNLLQRDVHANRTNTHDIDNANSIFSELDRIMENEQEQLNEEEVNEIPPFPGHHMFQNKYHTRGNTANESATPHHLFALTELSQRSTQHRSRPTRVTEVADEPEVKEPPAWLREINRHIARIGKPPEVEKSNYETELHPELEELQQNQKLKQERADSISNDSHREENIPEIKHDVSDVETHSSSSNSSSDNNNNNVNSKRVQNEIDNIPPWVIPNISGAVNDTETTNKNNKLVSEEQQQQKQHKNWENEEKKFVKKEQEQVSLQNCEEHDNVIDTVIGTDSNVNSYYSNNRNNSREINLISILQRQSELTPLSQRKGFNWSNTRTNSIFTVPSISMENSLSSFTRRLHDNSLNSDQVSKLLMISSNYGDSINSSNISNHNKNSFIHSNSFTHSNSLSLLRNEKRSALQSVQPHYDACASMESSPLTSEQGSLLNIFSCKSLKQAEPAVECPERALPQWLAFTLPRTSPAIQPSDKKKDEQEEEPGESNHSSALEEQSQTEEELEEEEDVKDLQSSLERPSITSQTKEFIFSSGHLASKENDATHVKPHTNNTTDYVNNYSRGKNAFSNLSLSSIDLCKLPIMRPALLDPTRRGESNNNGRRDNRNARWGEVNGRSTSVKAKTINVVHHANPLYDEIEMSENKSDFLLPVQTATSSTLSAMVNELVHNAEKKAKETHTDGNVILLETESIPHTRPQTSAFHSLETNEVSSLLNSVQEYFDPNTDVIDNSKSSIGSSNTNTSNTGNIHANSNHNDNIVAETNYRTTDSASIPDRAINSVSYMRSGFPWAAVREDSAYTYNSNDSGADDDIDNRSNNTKSSERSSISGNADEANTDTNRETNEEKIHACSWHGKQERVQEIQYEERYLEITDTAASLSDYFTEELANINSYNDTCWRDVVESKVTTEGYEEEEEEEEERNAISSRESNVSLLSYLSGIDLFPKVNSVEKEGA